MSCARSLHKNRGVKLLLQSMRCVQHSSRVEHTVSFSQEERGRFAGLRLTEDDALPAQSPTMKSLPLFWRSRDRVHRLTRAGA